MNPNLSDGFPEDVHPLQYLTLLSSKELLILFWQTDGLPALWTGSNLVEIVETQIVFTPAAGNKEVCKVGFTLLMSIHQGQSFEVSFSFSVYCLVPIIPTKNAWFHQKTLLMESRNYVQSLSFSASDLVTSETATTTLVRFSLKGVNVYLTRKNRGLSITMLRDAL